MTIPIERCDTLSKEPTKYVDMISWPEPKLTANALLCSLGNQGFVQFVKHETTGRAALGAL